MNKDSISELIRNRRNELQMSQTQLAKKAGLTSAAISQFESGARKPSFDALSKLSFALNVSTDYLLGNQVQSHDSTLTDPEFSIIFRDIVQFSEEDKKLIIDVYEFIKYRNEKKR
jgi:transcriptional regulator with XRE-family HTH domain